MAAQPAEQRYDVRDVNEITEWSALKFHLTKYTEQMEKLDRQDHPIPEKYDPEGQAMAEAEQILQNYESELESERENENRRDLSQNVIGIANDPDDAKDHDDAYNVFSNGEGYIAQVHIADVTHFVEKGSALDQRMKERGVTFYMGDNTRHMAPEKLAQEAFSLAPGRDSLALTIEMEFDRNGNRKDTEVYESIVDTEHLTYTHVDNIIDASDELDSFYDEMLPEQEEAQRFRDMVKNASDAKELASELRENRWEDSLILNDRDSESSKIVEELMVEANNALGDYLMEQADVGLYRVEEEPEEELGEVVADILVDHGYDPKNLDGDIHKQTAETLNNFFHRTNDSEPGIDTVKDDEEHEKEVRKEIVKNLERAEYKPSLEGECLHDGLDLLDYAQGTSPIRRLTDMGNHRLIKGEDWSWSNLVEMAETTTQQQMIADEASRVWYDAST